MARREAGAEGTPQTDLIFEAIIAGGQHPDEVREARQKLRSALDNHPEGERLQALLTELLNPGDSSPPAKRVTRFIDKIGRGSVLHPEGPYHSTLLELLSGDSVELKQFRDENALTASWREKRPLSK